MGIRGRCASAAVLLATLTACQGAHLTAAGVPGDARRGARSAASPGASRPATKGPGLNLLGQRFPGAGAEGGSAPPQRRPVLTEAQMRALTRTMEDRKPRTKSPAKVPTASERAALGAECFAGGNLDNPLRTTNRPNVLAPFLPLLNRVIHEAVKK